MDNGAARETVLGASWMVGHDIIFDFEKNQLGFAPAACPVHAVRPPPPPPLSTTPGPFATWPVALLGLAVLASSAFVLKRVWNAHRRRSAPAALPDLEPISDGLDESDVEEIPLEQYLELQRGATAG